VTPLTIDGLRNPLVSGCWWLITHKPVSPYCWRSDRFTFGIR
jgi:hypothetical protein